MPDQWPGQIVSPAPRSEDSWPGEVVHAAAPSGSYGDTLSRTTGISETPWYARGIFAGYGPSVTDAIDTLPAIGGAVGGALGLAGGTAAGMGVGGVPGAVAMAGVGGSAGESARQLARRAIGAYAPRTPGEAATNIGEQAAIQAAGELAGQGMGRALPAGAAMFAGQVDAPVAAAAARTGIEMPAAALSTSRVVPVVEAAAAKGVGGAEASARYVNAANSLTAMADHTVARASKLTDPIARGEAIAKGFDQFKSNWIRTKNQLYKQVDAELPKLTVTPQNTVQLLDEIIAQKQAAAKVLNGGPVEDLTFYQGMRDGLSARAPDGSVAVGSQRAVPAPELRAAMSEIDKKVEASFADPFAARNKGLLQKLSATLDEEFRGAVAAQSPKTAAKLAKADLVYSEGIGKINSTFGESIHKLAQDGKYDLIARAVANPRMSVADVPKILEVAGAEGSDAMRAAVIADLVSKAKNPAGTLTPQGLGRAIKTFGEDRLSAILQPDQFAKLKDLATLSASLQKGERVMNGSQTAYLLSTMNLPAAVYHVVGSPARRFIASKAGQRWLTTGYQPFSARTGARIGSATMHAATLPSTAEDEE